MASAPVKVRRYAISGSGHTHVPMRPPPTVVPLRSPVLNPPYAPGSPLTASSPSLIGSKFAQVGFSSGCCRCPPKKLRVCAVAEAPKSNRIYSVCGEAQNALVHIGLGSGPPRGPHIRCPVQLQDESELIHCVQQCRCQRWLECWRGRSFRRRDWLRCGSSCAVGTGSILGVSVDAATGSGVGVALRQAQVWVWASRRGSGVGVGAATSSGVGVGVATGSGTTVATGAASWETDSSPGVATSVRCSCSGAAVGRRSEMDARVTTEEGSVLIWRPGHRERHPGSRHTQQIRLKLPQK